MANESKNVANFLVMLRYKIFSNDEPKKTTEIVRKRVAQLICRRCNLCLMFE